MNDFPRRRPRPLARYAASALACCVALRGAAAPPVLEGTAPLAWPEADLSARMMDGAHAFVERKIADAGATRGRSWPRDLANADAYLKSIAAQRARFASRVGVVDARLPAALERYGDDAAPARVGETAGYEVWQVRWPVVEGVWGVGLQVRPKSAPRAHVVVVPDADQAPEDLLRHAGVRQLAEHGVELILPVTISREKLATDDRQLRASDQTYREWIYRQAFHLGRHVIGYDVQVALAAIDGFKARNPTAPVGLAGHGEGGLVAMYAAAIDPRVESALVSGYFDSRERVWSEPIYRNVWGLLREFGDAEIASLVQPRTLVVEHSQVPRVTGHKGEWGTPDLARIRRELARLPQAPWLPVPRLVHGAEEGTTGPYSAAAVAEFAAGLRLGKLAESVGEGPMEQRVRFDLGARHARFVGEVEGHVQRLIRKSDAQRDAFFLHAVMPEFAESRWSTARRHPTHPPERFIAGAKRYRELFHTEGMGRFDEPLLPVAARSRLVAETGQWAAHDVVLDVHPELFAWGLLVVPKDLRPGERRPVVVVQHGRNGLPRDLLDKEDSAYNRVAARLAERGFIAFAPHNLYRGEDRYRWLSRKANSVQASLFSFILAQHEQILRWLATRPDVDPARIGFYGLSYGGETAVRVPPILEGYALSVCSGDFNQWTRKVASTEVPFSFMRTIEWEMPYWNLGATFDYAEMAYLMFPRPFMVERGHHDRVGRDPWVAYEYAKVRWLYAQFGLADRTEIEFFQGGHSMNQEGAFAFLHRHLNWPQR